MKAELLNYEFLKILQNLRLLFFSDLRFQCQGIETPLASASSRPGELWRSDFQDNEIEMDRTCTV